MANLKLFIILNLISFRSIFVHGWYDGDACCAIAKSEDKFLHISAQDAVCGQQYSLLSNGTPIAAAPDAYVSYSYCKTRCPGWGRSKANVPSQWAAPIVQFLLPSVIFALTTPRTREMETRESWLYKMVELRVRKWSTSWMNAQVARFVRWIMKAILADFLVVIVDTAVWIFTIIALAGPMLIEGLFEALLDFRIIQFVRSFRFRPDGAGDYPRTELLLTVVSGNLALDVVEPQKKILAALDLTVTPRSEHDAPLRQAAVQTRLLSMMGSQSSFGATVGAPVLFYLGAFVYTILDLENSPSSQDAAISLAFGIEWMIVVHVAIVAGCLLASNNPGTSSAIVGILPERAVHITRTDSRHANLRSGDSRTAHDISESQICQEPQEIETTMPPTFAVVAWHGCVKGLEKLTGWSDAYYTVFQPVPMWQRGSNKMRWLRETAAWKSGSDDAGIRKSVGVLKWYWLFPPTFVFVMLPSIAGAVVAYATPPVGFGCRSLSFICYAGCQFILTIRATNELDAQSGSLWPWLKWLSKPWEWIARVTNWGIKIVTRLLSFLPSSTQICLSIFFVWLPLTAIPIVGSLFTAVGGTLMQVIGVYRTCFCYVNSPWWIHLDISPGVNLATDTYGARVSSRHWLQAGIAATGFMAVACYIGWAYQERLRYLFTKEVHALYVDENGNTARSDGQQMTELSRIAGGEDRRPLLSRATWSDTTSEQVTIRASGEGRENRWGEDVTLHIIQVGRYFLVAALTF